MVSAGHSWGRENENRLSEHIKFQTSRFLEKLSRNTDWLQLCNQMPHFQSSILSGHVLLWMLFSCFVSAGVREASLLGNEGWSDYSCFTAQLKPAVKLVQRGCCIMLESATHFSFNFLKYPCIYARFCRLYPLLEMKNHLCSSALLHLIDCFIKRTHS